MGGRELDNAAIANVLGRFAAVLDLAGASHYSIRAPLAGLRP